MQNLIGLRIRGWFVFFYLIDIIFVALAFFLASWLSSLSSRYHFIPQSKDLIIFLTCMIGILVSLLSSGIQGGYFDAIYRGRCLSIVIQQLVFVSVPVFFYIAIWRDTFVSRSVVLIFLAILIPSLYASKVAFKILAKGGVLPLPEFLRVLVVKNADSDNSIAKWLSENRGLGISYRGSVCIYGTPDMDSILSELEQALEAKGPNLVIWSGDLDSALLSNAKVLVERHGAHLSIDLSHLAHSSSDQRTGGSPLECLISLTKHPLVSPANSLVKRLIDIGVSLPAIVFVLPPFCLAVWVLHRVCSPGPLFFLQKRSGSHGQTFYVRKFRTMFVDHGEDGKQARRGDKRMFPGGDLIRKLSIDELPQFINVLLGQMSVVGPRPHMLEHDVIFARDFEKYKLRHMVKPGITGLAQVRGHRGPIDHPEEIRARLTSDLEYCERWSVSLDLAIIFRTVAHVFSFHSKSC